MLEQTIRKCLTQTHPDYEILVVDNGSSDRTKEMMEGWSGHPGIRYHRHEENLGILENYRSAVYDLCSSEFAVILSDDDHLIDDDFLSEAATVFNSNPTVSAVAGGIIYHSPPAPERIILPPRHGRLSREEYFLSFRDMNVRPSGISATSFRRSSLLSYKVFQQDVPCFDLYFMDILALAGDWHLLKKPVLFYQKHENNFSSKGGNYKSWRSCIADQSKLFLIPVEIRDYATNSSIDQSAIDHYYTTYIQRIYYGMLFQIMLMTGWKYKPVHLAYRYCCKHFQLNLPHPLISYIAMWCSRLKEKCSKCTLPIRDLAHSSG